MRLMTVPWWLVSGSWVWEPSVLVGLALLAAGYSALVGPLRRRNLWGEPVSIGRQLCFYLGTFSVFIALISPLDVIADRMLFSAHMAQHMLLTYVAPPLWLIGLPGWTTALIGRAGWVGSVFDRLTRPALAFVLFNGTMWAWHVPALYDAALRTEWLHIVEHLLFMATAVLGWWPAIRKWPAASSLSPNLGRLLYLVLSMLPCTGLAALITFSTRPLYPFYVQSPWRWMMAVSPLLDQQVGGVLMWLPADMILMVTAMIAASRWLGEQMSGPHPWNPAATATVR
jgi:putative membrane protein